MLCQTVTLATAILLHYSSYLIIEAYLFISSDPELEENCIAQEFGTCVTEDSIKNSQLRDGEYV